MSQFPDTLRTWRKARRLSQLDLAGEADVSARHISFLESGRANPSRDMIARLGDALMLPLDARNHMLTHAGFAPRYQGRRWSDDEMAPVRAAVSHTLRAHMPYPALAVDRLWRVLDMNVTAQNLYGLVGVAQGDSLLDLMRSTVLPSFVENWPEVARHVCQRLRVESTAQGGVPELDQTADHLDRVGAPAIQTQSPVLPTVFVAGDLRLSIFATITQFGTPQDVTLDDLKIELYFPTDPESEAALARLAE